MSRHELKGYSSYLKRMMRRLLERHETLYQEFIDTAQLRLEGMERTAGRPLETETVRPLVLAWFAEFFEDHERFPVASFIEWRDSTSAALASFRMSGLPGMEEREAAQVAG